MPGATDQPVIRVMARPEIDTAIEWAAREGWNPGLADADAFHAADPEYGRRVEEAVRRIAEALPRLVA